MFFLLLFGILTLNKLRETYDQPLKENVEEMNDELLNNVYVLWFLMQYLISLIKNVILNYNNKFYLIKWMSTLN